MKDNFVQQYLKEIYYLEIFLSVPVRCHLEFSKGIHKPNSTEMTSAISNILKYPVFHLHFQCPATGMCLHTQ